MYFRKILFKVLLQFAVIAYCQYTSAQTIPTAPAELEFAGVTVQLTVTARQRLQQSLASLYADRSLLARQVDLLNQLKPLLDQRLSARKIPVDFRYACPPFPNSTYDPYAYWGISQPQAGQLRLLVNQTVDNRRHVLLATDALIPRFEQLQQRNNHWMRTLFQHFDPLVKSGSKERDATRWLLDVEAPTAIWTTLARKIAFEQEQALLKFMPAFLLLEYNEGAGKTLSEIASRLNLNTDRLSPYNTWLLANRIPAGSTAPVILRLTPEEYLTVKPRLNSKATRSLAANQLESNDLGFPLLRRLGPDPTYKSVILYQINGQRGIQAQLCDNAITLAYYGKLSVASFLKINDLTLQNTLRPGEVYYLKPKAKRAKIPYHVVQPSQTLWDISAMYGVRLKSLNRYNQLKPTQRVQTGRIVWLQRKRPRKFPVEYQTIPPAEKPPVDTTLTPAIPPPATDSTKQLTTVTSNRPVSRADSVMTVKTVVVGAKSDSVTTRPANPVAPVVSPAVTSTSTSAPLAVTRIHVVKAKQTYFSIARLYGISLGQLYTSNGLSERQPLAIGQELIIDTPNPSATDRPATVRPRRKPSVAVNKPLTKPATPVAAPINRPAPPVAAPTKRPSPPVATPTNRPTTPVGVGTPKGYYYTVKRGETIYRIALNNSVRVDQLVRWNGLKNFAIEPGQRLLIRR